MAKSIDLGELAIAIAIKTQALEDGLKATQKKLKDFSGELNKAMSATESGKQLEQQVKQTEQNFDKLAVAADVAFGVIVVAIKKGIDAYNQYNNAMTGLKSIVQGTGNDFQKSQNFIDDFTKDGLVPASQAAASLKNLLSGGFSFDQATAVMERFKDSAAFGRQGFLDMGSAIEGATQGLKNQISNLVDNVGVTKNLSQMWKEYAATVGKTEGQLTDAEKVQAEYVGILQATKYQLGDAAKYSKELGGSQAQASAATLKLGQAFGQSLAPAMAAALALITPLVTGLAEFVKSHQELVAVITIVVAGLTGFVAVISTVRAAIAILGPAMAALNVSFAGLVANPVVLALTAIAVVAAVIAVNVQKAKKEQDEYNAAVERFNKIKQNGATKADAPQLKEDVDNLQETISQYDELMGKFDELKKKAGDLKPSLTILNDAQNKTGISVDDLKEKFNKLGLSFNMANNDITEARKRLIDLKQAQFEANRVTTDEYNTQVKSIATKKAALSQTDQLIKQYKDAKSGSKEWQDAQQKLAEQFPQFSSASGVEIDAIENVQKAQKSAVDVEWTLLKAKIQISIQDIERIKATRDAQIQALMDQQKAAIILEKKYADFGKLGAFGSSSESFLQKTNKELKTQSDYVGGLNSDLDAMKALLNTDLSKVTGVKPITYDTGGGEGKDPMQEALSVMEYKKHMNQLSLQDEITTLQQIEAKYADTADKKMEIDEKIYDVKQALLQKQKDDEQRALEASKQWIEDKKFYNDLSAQDEIAAYERVKNKYNTNIDVVKEMNKNIYTAKLKIAKDAINEEKEATEKALDNEIKARQEAYSKEENLLKSREDAEVKSLQTSEDAEIKSIEVRSKAYEKAYNDKIKLIEKETDAQVSALQTQINAIDAQTNAENEVKQEQDKQQKLADLKSQYAEVAANNTVESQQKAVEYQKQISDAEYEIQHDAILKEREDKKTALQEQIDNIKANADAKKQQLQDEYDAQKEALENERQMIQDAYTQREETTKSHYENLIAQAKSLSDTRIAILEDEKTKADKIYADMLSNAGKGGTVQNYAAPSATVAASPSAAALTQIIQAIPNLDQKIKEMSQKMNVDSGVAKDMVVNDALKKANTSIVVNNNIQGSVVTEKQLTNTIQNNINKNLGLAGVK